jgi:polysaccharide pyruvyl transferase CsaB
MKILLASMRMDIGGAETHVLELAKALKDRGHTVVVISEGGIFVPTLVSYGIEHIIAPLSSKKPTDIIKSYIILQNSIKEMQFDIVHSHARIPNFIINILRFKYRFGFVSTLHFAFTKNKIVEKFTVWGQKNLTVSDDLRRHLIKNSSIKSRDITTTVNGISKELFSAENRDENLLTELNLKKDSKKIVCVCRLETGNCDSAYLLIEKAVEINKKLSNVQIVIVGDGNAFNDILTKSIEVNKLTKENTVILTGGRSDVNKILLFADVVVGISRVALEAMAAGKITVLTGSYGHFGILTEKDFDINKLTNFTCRGLELPTANKILRAVCDAYRLEKTKKETITSYLKERVLQEYSSDRMCNDALKVYEQILKETKKSDIVLSGYYGFSNSGDDAILKMIIKEITDYNPNIGITVLSNMPADVKRVHKVNSVNRWNIFAVIKVLSEAKLFISGGGSVIQDATSTKSLLYYLFLIVLARSFKNKVMLYANGIGPINKKRNRKLAKEVLNKVDVITLREEDSQDTLNELGIINPKTAVTCDPVIGITEINEEEVDNLLFRYGLMGKKYIVVSLRDWKTISSFEDGLIASLNEIKKKHLCELLFLPMQYPLDVAINKKFARLTNSLCYDKRLTAEMTIGIAQKSILAIGMRLHLLIYAFTAAIPSVGIAYDPKVESVMKYFGQDTYLGLLEFTKLSFTAKVDRIIQNLPEYKENLSGRLIDLKEKNKKNIELVIKLLEDN